MNRLIVAILLLCSPLFVSAQDTGFVQSAFSNLTIAVGDSSIAISCFEGARNSEPNSTKVYAFSPYFQIVKPNSGAPYKVINAPGSKKTVRVTVALYDDALKQAVAQWISRQTDSDVGIGSVQPLPIYSLTVTENNSGASTTLPYGAVPPNTSLSLSPVMDVYFHNLDAATASQLTGLIDSQDADFSFTFFYKTSSNSLGAYTVRYDDIHSNSVFNQLTGNGGVGLVTRAGVARISSAITQSLTVTSYCEESSCQANLTQDLINLFSDKMQFNKMIDYTDNAAMSQLDELTIDPRGKDFEAATLNTIHDALTTSKDYNDLNHKILEAHLSGGYGPFHADGGFSSNDEVNKAIKETFDHDWTGNNWSTVPKTINVYQINGADFRGSGIVRQVQVKATFSMRSFQSDPEQAYLTTAGLASATKNGNAELFVMVPVGAVMAFSGPVANKGLGTNWLLCDGSALSKDKYPALYAAIGTTYGNGTDATGAKTGDFNLPDYRGLFLRGDDRGTGRDKGPRTLQAGGPGSGVGTLEDWSTARPKTDFVTSLNGGSTPSTTFNFYPEYDGASPYNWAGSEHEMLRPVGTRDTRAQDNHPIATSGVPAHTHTVSSGGDAETRPANSSVNWLIRAR